MLTRGLFNTLHRAPVDNSKPILMVIGDEKLHTAKAMRRREILGITWRKGWDIVLASAVGGVDVTKYSRVCCSGRAGVKALLCRNFSPLDVRKGWSYIDTPAATIPVWWIPDLLEHDSNKFYMEAYLEDWEWGCKFKFEDILPLQGTYDLVETPADSLVALKTAVKADWAAYDCETVGTMWTDFFEVVTMAITTSNLQTYVYNRSVLKNKEVQGQIASYMSNPKAKKVGHNLKYDTLSIRSWLGAEVKGVYSDTMLKRKLLEAHTPGNLDLCSELVGMGGYKGEFNEQLLVSTSLLNKLRRNPPNRKQLSLFAEVSLDPIVVGALESPEDSVKKFAYGLVKEETLSLYCARDALATAKLEVHLNEKLRECPPIKEFWCSIMYKATRTFDQIQTWGILVDKKQLKKTSKYIQKKVDDVEATLKGYGLENPSSSDQVRGLLFGELGLKPIRKSEKTGNASTDSPSLEELRRVYAEKGEKHKILDDLLEFRRLSKLNSAYGDKLAAFIRNDGRIHPEFRITGTETGRLSVAEPGLHQIPRSESKEGGMIKACFVASPGWKLISIDYSQLELRIAAMIAKDKVMKGLFESGSDFHLENAKLIAPIMGEDPTKLTKKSPLRTYAKQFSFGLIYGMSDFAMAKQLGVDVQIAKDLRRAVLANWSSYNKWSVDVVKSTKKTGYTWTYWNGKKARRRFLGGIAEDQGTKLGKKAFKKAKNGAINTPIQGSASDFCLASIIKIVDWIKGNNIQAKLVLTVHDSIILEAKESIVYDVARKVSKIMTSWDSDGYPIKVDIEIGEKWGKLEEWSGEE